MGSFCDGSIIFFSIRLFSNRPSNHNNTQEEKFSLLQAVFSERRRGEQDFYRVTQKRKKHGHIQSLPEYRVTRYESVLLQSNPTTIVLLLVQCYKNRQYTQVFIHQLVILHSRKIGKFLRKAFPTHITYRVYVQYMHTPQQAKNPEKKAIQGSLTL